MRAGSFTTVGAPTAALLPMPLFGMPWYGYVVLCGSFALAYGVRWYVILILGRKALDRAESRSIPDVIAAITGTSTPRSPPRARQNPKRGTPPDGDDRPDEHR